MSCPCEVGEVYWLLKRYTKLDLIRRETNSILWQELDLSDPVQCAFILKRMHMMLLKVIGMNFRIWGKGDTVKRLRNSQYSCHVIKWHIKLDIVFEIFFFLEYLISCMYYDYGLLGTYNSVAHHFTVIQVCHLVFAK